MPWNWPWSSPAQAAPAPPPPTPQQPQPGNPATKPRSKVASRLVNTAGGAAVLAVATIGGFEGYSSVAYPDPATMGHPWTICYGETAGIKKGMTKTLAECKALLTESMRKFAVSIDKCLTRDITSDTRAVAYLSLAYNIGPGAFCKSSIARLHNQGRQQAACDAILLYNKAAGKVMRGLQNRREQERRLCLQETLL